MNVIFLFKNIKHMGIFKFVTILMVIMTMMGLSVFFYNRQKDLKEMFVGNSDDAYYDVIQRMFNEIKKRDPEQDELRHLKRKMRNPNDKETVMEHFATWNETDQNDDDVKTIGDILEENSERASHEDIIRQLSKSYLIREPTDKEMRRYKKIMEEEDGNPERIIIKMKRTKEYRNMEKQSSTRSTVSGADQASMQFARVMPHPDDNKGKRQKFKNTLDQVSNKEKANLYQNIVQLYDSVMRRLPTMYELDYYASKIINTVRSETPFNMDALRRILQSSREYKILMKSQTNLVDSELPMNISAQQLEYEVSDIFERTRDKNASLSFANNGMSIDSKVKSYLEESGEIPTSLFQFLKDKYVEYELDENKLVKLITLFLQFETGIQQDIGDTGNKELSEDDEDESYVGSDSLATINRVSREENDGVNSKTAKVKVKKNNLDPDDTTPTWESKKKKRDERSEGKEKATGEGEKESDENPLSLDDRNVDITMDMRSAKNAKPSETMGHAKTIHQPGISKDPFSRLHECMSFNYSRQNAIAHMQNERNKAELQLLLDRQHKLSREEEKKMKTIMYRQYKPTVFESGELDNYGVAPIDEAFGTLRSL